MSLQAENRGIQTGNTNLKYDKMLIKLYYWMQIKLLKDDTTNMNSATPPATPLQTYYSVELLNSYNTRLYSISASLLKHIACRMFQFRITSHTSSPYTPSSTLIEDLVDAVQIDIFRYPSSHSLSLSIPLFEPPYLYAASKNNDLWFKFIYISLIIFLNLRFVGNINKCTSQNDIINISKRLLGFVWNDVFQVLQYASVPYFNDKPITSPRTIDDYIIKDILDYVITRFYKQHSPTNHSGTTLPVSKIPKPPGAPSPADPSPINFMGSPFGTGVSCDPEPLIILATALSYFSTISSNITLGAPSLFEPSNIYYGITNPHLKTEWEIIYTDKENEYYSNPELPPFNQFTIGDPFPDFLEEVFIKILKHRNVKYIDKTRLNGLYAKFITGKSDTDRKKIFDDLISMVDTSLPKVKDTRGAATFAGNKLQHATIESSSSLSSLTTHCSQPGVAALFNHTIKVMPGKSSDTNKTKWGLLAASNTLILLTDAELKTIRENWFNGNNKKAAINHNLKGLGSSKKYLNGQWHLINGWKILMANKCWLCGHPVYFFCLYISTSTSATNHKKDYKRSASLPPPNWQDIDEDNLLLFIYDNNDEHVLPPGIGNVAGTLLPTYAETMNMFNPTPPTEISAISFGLLPSHAFCNQTKSFTDFLSLPDGTNCFSINRVGLDQYYEDIATLIHGNNILTGIDPTIIEEINKGTPNNIAALTARAKQIYDKQITPIIDHLCNYLNTGNFLLAPPVPPLATSYKKMHVCTKLKTILILIYILKGNDQQPQHVQHFSLFGGSNFESFHQEIRKLEDIKKTIFKVDAQMNIDYVNTRIDIYNTLTASHLPKAEFGKTGFESIKEREFSIIQERESRMLRVPTWEENFFNNNGIRLWIEQEMSYKSEEKGPALKPAFLGKPNYQLLNYEPRKDDRFAYRQPGPAAANTGAAAANTGAKPGAANPSHVHQFYEVSLEGPFGKRDYKGNIFFSLSSNLLKTTDFSEEPYSLVLPVIRNCVLTDTIFDENKELPLQNEYIQGGVKTFNGFLGFFSKFEYLKKKYHRINLLCSTQDGHRPMIICQPPSHLIDNCQMTNLNGTLLTGVVAHYSYHKTADLNRYKQLINKPENERGYYNLVLQEVLDGDKVVPLLKECFVYMVLVEFEFGTGDFIPLFYFIFPKTEGRLIAKLIDYCSIYFNNQEQHPEQPSLNDL